VDPDTHQVKTDFLAVDDILASSISADAETIKSVALQQLINSNLDVMKLSGLATDGASVMVGKKGGVALNPLAPIGHWSGLATSRP